MMEHSSTLFETLAFRVSSSSYFSILFRQLLSKWWSALLLILILLIGAICFDVRFGIILLIFLFLILPLILFFVYYNYALRPEAFYSVVEKTVLIKEDGIYCIYDERERPVFKWQQVERIVLHKKAFLIYTGKYTYFYLLRSAFASIEDMNDFQTNYLPRFIS